MNCKCFSFISCLFWPCHQRRDEETSQDLYEIMVGGTNSNQLGDLLYNL